jgi:hypothetical protein
MNGCGEPYVVYAPVVFIPQPVSQEIRPPPENLPPPPA